MTTHLHTVPGPFERGTVLDRPNRFVLRVALEDGSEIDAYISNTGSWNVTKPDRPVLVRRVSDPDRKTDYDARFVYTESVWVSIDATFPNTAFRLALEKGLLPAFQGYSLSRSEPPLPSGGRADFSLRTPGGTAALVEVKSCTLVEEGMATFPDRPTERGRRHLRDLRALQHDGPETHVVFVVQRSDGDGFVPNATVDPEFASLLGAAAASGVGVHAMQLDVQPPDVFLERGDVPVILPDNADSQGDGKTDRRE